MDFNDEEDLLEEEEKNLEQSEGFANDIANPSSSDNFNNEEQLIEEPKGLTKKKNLPKLLNPKSLLIIVIILLTLPIFITILVKHLDFDLVGIGEPKPEYYESLTCEKINLAWENDSYTKKHQYDEDYEEITDPSLVNLNDTERFQYESYEIDDFVAGVVWTDNNNAMDVDNEIVYQAMAIAARSRLIAELPDNCVVLKNYNEQAKSFKELDGSEEKYSEIMGAIQLSQGIIIGREGNIIPALYEPFSYIKKRKDENESYNRNYFYYMMNENIEEQQLIPAEWVDDLEIKKGKKIPKVKETHTKKLESMSLYGAKYLLEKVDSQYELYRLLEYYYGRDIEYYTISYAFSDLYSGIGCSAISMTSTTLSKEEFIRLAEQYASRKSNARILADNAGMIYDMAIANGINPELVFIRADVEGYSPGSSKNNYWGLGCTNTGGYDACISYNSLSSGVAGFLQFVSKYSTLNELMGHYAYLGDYWYNPGSWSVGGCVYASAIYGNNIPDRVREACASGKTCTTAGGGDCVATTAEDKEAYLTFQARSMLDARQKIFGLSADQCIPSYQIGEVGNGSCTIWRQGDERWGNIHLGSSKTTMKESGCAVTSVAIAISCSGVKINNVVEFNPGTLVKLMNSTGGFKGAGMYWGNSAIKALAPSFQYKTYEDLTGSNQDKMNTVYKYAGSNRSLILHFKNDAHPRGHYVVLKSISNDNFIVYDPGNGKINTYNVADLDKIVVYEYQE